MMPTTISTRTVEDILIASVRFWGQPDDAPARFQALCEPIRSYVSGPMIRLYHAYDPARGYDMEVGVPVSQAIPRDDIQTRTLPGGPMLCARHTGPLEDFPQTRQAVIDLIRANAVGIAEHPAYTIWLEGAETHADDTARYVTEIRLPLLWPRWLEQMAEGLDRHVGEDTRRRVMAGSDALDVDTPALTKTGWAQALMARFDAAVPDEAARRDIVNRCAHVFPQERIDHLRAEYLRLGSLDALFELMAQDRSVDGTSFYAHPYRAGDAIIETKLPADPEGYANATDPKEKRASYCFCPLIRTAIRRDIEMSDTFCHCGAGWFRRLWEGVLEQPVWIEVQKTVLRGDDRCQFAVHLPTGIE
jgi:effector-binding domain-containing protein